MFVNKKLYYVITFSLCVLLGFLLPGNVYATNNFSGWIGNCSSGTNCDTNPSSPGYQGTTAFCNDCAVNVPGSTKNGQFYNPEFLALDKTGNIYVDDVSNNRIQKFNSDGVFQGWIGDCSSGTNCDTTNHVTTGFCNDCVVGSYGSGPGQFNSPLGIAFDSLGNIYVPDYGNNRVEKFNSAGVFESQIGCPSGACSSSYGPGGFTGPNAIAIDSTDSIYVIDGGNERVEKFSPSGAFQFQIGCPSGECLGGTGNGQFGINSPRAITVDKSNNVYVLDWINNRVEIFNSDGVYQSQFGTTNGIGNTSYDDVFGVAVDTSGNIYVTDASNNRVEQFNSAGVFESQIGCPSGACSYGVGNGQFYGPYGITLDQSNNIYVSDSGNNRVEKFSAPVSNSYDIQVGDANGNCEIIGGTWSSGNTCTINSFTINSGDSLTTEVGVNFVITGTLTNYGTVNYVTLANNSGGTINNYGIMSSNEFYGNLYNHGSINNNSGGTMINHQGSVIYNYAGANFNNSGIITNIDSATIYNYGTFTNNAGGTINNTFHIANTAGGTMNNSGTININGGAIYNDASSTINNNSGGTINNTSVGVINNNSGGTINNYGTIINSGGIANSGTINEYCGSTFTNTGSIPGNQIVNLCNSTDTVQSSTGAGQVTFTTSSGGFSSLTAVSQSSLSTPPPTGSYPFGFFSWTISGLTQGGSTNVCMIYPSDPGTVYEKLIGTTWNQIPVTKTANPDGSVKVCMTLTDGASGQDSDQTVNGQITDPGGMASHSFELQVGDANGACEAIGGISNGGNLCNINNLTLGTGDSLTVDANTGLNMTGTSTISGTLTLNGNIYNYIGTLTNNGIININSGGNIGNYGVLINDGQITNSGTITDYCGTTFSNSGTFTGNGIVYNCPTESVPSSTGSGPVTFSSSMGGFSSLTAVPQSNLPTPPPSGNYPFGFFSFTVSSLPSSGPPATITVPIILPSTSADGSEYYKLVGGIWQPAGVVVGNTVTLTITDNGPLDNNPTQGVISDPGTISESTNGRVSGAGDIAKNTDFSFAVKSDNDAKHKTKGSLDYDDKSAKIKFHSDGISFLSVNPSTTGATFVGKGDLDKHKGDVTILASINDPDKKGERDTFSIIITDSTGKVLYHNVGTVKGHVEIHKFSDHDDKSDSGVSH